MSAGVATMPEHAEDGRGLILAADHALYAAKDAGRDRVHGARSLSPASSDEARSA